MSRRSRIAKRRARAIARAQDARRRERELERAMGVDRSQIRFRFPGFARLLREEIAKAHGIAFDASIINGR